MSSEFETGIFIEECKNRFLCKVSIKGQEEICYISSSSKLTSFIQLKDRKVLLKKNSNIKSKTNYTVHAVQSNQEYILLNLVYINNLLKAEFNKTDSIYYGSNTIYSERKIVDNLKSDFYIDGNRKIIIEAKGIITEESLALFPSMRVQRAVIQLKILNELLRKGYDVHYYIVLMNPNINDLVLNKEKTEFYHAFRNCIKNGMELFVYKTIWNNECFSVVRDTKVEIIFKNTIHKKKLCR